MSVCALTACSLSRHQFVTKHCYNIDMKYVWKSYVRRYSIYLPFSEMWLRLPLFAPRLHPMTPIYFCVHGRQEARCCGLGRCETGQQRVPFISAAIFGPMWPPVFDDSAAVMLHRLICRYQISVQCEGFSFIKHWLQLQQKKVPIVFVMSSRSFTRSGTLKLISQAPSSGQTRSQQSIVRVGPPGKSFCCFCSDIAGISHPQ